MTVKDIAEQAAYYTGVSVDFNTESTERTEFTKCTTDLLVRFTGEITDIKKRGVYYASNGKINYSLFGSDFKRVITLYKGGVKRSFYEEADGISVEEDGEYEVVYAVIIRPALLTDTVSLPPKFSPAVLALGVASEYCRKKGFYKESEIYGDRFTEAVKNLDRTARSVTLKAVSV